MRRTLCASLGAVLALLVWAGTAAADTGSAAAPAAGAAPGDPSAAALALVAGYLPAGTLEDAAPAGAPADEAAAVDDAAPAEPDAGSSQANGTLAGSLGANANETGQSVEQASPGATPAPAPAPSLAPAAAPAPAVPAGGGTQVAGQSAESTQTAAAHADATQVAPVNESVAVRIGSPGDAGPVEQSNDAVALSGALNANRTAQDAAQSQGGGGGTQVAGQTATSDQAAAAHADATQAHPRNTNVSVRIFSPGNDGPVSQSNTAAAGALAGNGNQTSQAAGQTGSGGGSQVAGQKAENAQAADAGATATQVHPRNTNVSVRIFSPGDNGPVTQSNTAGALALAGNANATTQSATQAQAGGAADACRTSVPCTAPGGGTQVVGQTATNAQCACADATATQVAPSNESQSVRVHSPGADGPVTQANGTLALAGALNANRTTQTAAQSQGGGAPAPACASSCSPSGTAVQAVGQKATSEQDATASADALQVAPSNAHSPVRVGSPGGGGGVTQANAVLAGSLAANLNGTEQSARQGQAGGGGTAVQAAGQLAESRQAADADADAAQCCAANVAAPVRVLSWGEDGFLRQSNVVGALALGLNANRTGQAVAQSGGGGGGTSVQAAGQKAENDQHAAADADAFQLNPSNVAAPISVLPKGDRCGQPDRCREPERKGGRCPSPPDEGSCQPKELDRRDACERGGLHEKRAPCSYERPSCARPERDARCASLGCDRRPAPCGRKEVPVP